MPASLYEGMFLLDTGKAAAAWEDTVKHVHDILTKHHSEIVASRHPGAEEMDAYERVLGDSIAGDATLFAREDSVEEAWRIVDPVLRDPPRLIEYEPNSWGPQELDRIVSPVGGWQNPAGVEEREARGGQWPDARKP